MVLRTEASPVPGTPASIFDNEWSENGGTEPFGGLEAIADFNASFSSNNVDGIDSLPLDTSSFPSDNINSALKNDGSSPHQRCFDTSVARSRLADLQDTLDSHLSPGEVATPINDRYNGLPDQYMEDAALSSWTDSTDYGDFPEIQEAHWIPLIRPTIEMPRAAPMHQQPTLQPCMNPHPFQRRSVSEPPGGPFPAHIAHQYPPAAFPQHDLTPVPWNLPRQMAPQPPQLVRLKPQPRGRRPTTAQAQPTRRHRMEKRHYTRQATKRAGGPTSMPSSPVQTHALMDEVPIGHPYQPQSPHMSTLQLISTRVCTPTPSPTRVRSPMIAEAAPPPWTAAGSERYAEIYQSSVAIPVSIENLQDMITNAVRKAVHELQSQDDGQDN